MACKDPDCAYIREIWKDTVEGSRQAAAAWKQVATSLRERNEELEEELEELRRVLSDVVQQKTGQKESGDHFFDAASYWGTHGKRGD